MIMAFPGLQYFSDSQKQIVLFSFETHFLVIKKEHSEIN